MNFLSSDISAPSAIAFVDYCKSITEELYTKFIKSTECHAFINSIRVHVGVSAKTHLLECMQSFNGFIVDLSGEGGGDDDFDKLSSGGAQMKDEEIDWAKLAKVSSSTLETFIPLLSISEHIAEINKTCRHALHGYCVALL